MARGRTHVSHRSGNSGISIVLSDLLDASVRRDTQSSWSTRPWGLGQVAQRPTAGWRASSREAELRHRCLTPEIGRAHV